MVSTILILVLALIVMIWLNHQFKNFSHKVVAIFLVLLLVFTYFGFSSAIKGKDIDLKSTEGWKTGGKLYGLWLANAFKNVKTATGNLINMDWKVQEINESDSYSKS